MEVPLVPLESCVDDGQDRGRYIDEGHESDKLVRRAENCLGISRERCTIALRGQRSYHWRANYSLLSFVVLVPSVDLAV